jgi:mRNA-degrading endonuclease RelE of RelBE toxin-antitoxin system
VNGSAADDYQIRVEESVQGAIERLPKAYQNKVFRLWKSHLCKQPTQRIPGKLKELKGRYKGYYQFDINDKDRMIYSVDEAERVVYVEYVGPHPDWKSGRRRPF